MCCKTSMQREVIRNMHDAAWFFASTCMLLQLALDQAL